jgi:hypothetical protein
MTNKLEYNYIFSTLKGEEYKYFYCIYKSIMSSDEGKKERMLTSTLKRG